jgi:protoheme IX farnesyltransferase
VGGSVTQVQTRKTNRAAAYLALTKPRVIELLLATTVPTMFLAAQGVPSLWLVLATLVGGSLAAGGANVFNCVIDRDIDAIMHRTRSRPTATGEVTARQAIVWAIVLTVGAVGWLSLTVNLVSAALAAFAIGFYVVGYSVILKRRTAQNIVWGGIAGCMPVLIGWSAVTGGLAWPPVVLFLVVFFWTPPHYWPLSLNYQEDYASAGIPMLPVVKDRVSVAGSIVRYSWVMVLVSIALWPVAGTSLFYPIAAGVLGALFLWEAHRLSRAARAEMVLRPLRLFHWSITYLALLFAAVAIDPFLR